jgi:predicted RNase H-like HicB family nuclease
VAASPLRFKVKVAFDKADGLWYADCLDLQGCHTFGESKEEAMEKIADAIGDRLYAGLETFKQSVERKASASWSARGSTETIAIPA